MLVDQGHLMESTREIPTQGTDVRQGRPVSVTSTSKFIKVTLTIQPEL